MHLPSHIPPARTGLCSQQPIANGNVRGRVLLNGYIALIRSRFSVCLNLVSRNPARDATDGHHASRKDGRHAALHEVSILHSPGPTCCLCTTYQPCMTTCRRDVTNSSLEATARGGSTFDITTLLPATLSLVTLSLDTADPTLEAIAGGASTSPPCHWTLQIQLVNGPWLPTTTQPKRFQRQRESYHPREPCIKYDWEIDAGRSKAQSTFKVQRPAQRDPDLVMQLDSRPIPQELLASEVKSIYAVLTMVETECIYVDQAQVRCSAGRSESNTNLASNYWQPLFALHRTLLHEHYDFFFVASQYPSASPALRRFAAMYSMSSRMWKYGIHSFLELRRRRLLDSTDYLLAFIYFAYQIMALLYKTVLAFEDTWIERLGDLARHRMAIEDEDFQDRETWAGVARSWYSRSHDLLSMSIQRRIFEEFPASSQE